MLADFLAQELAHLGPTITVSTSPCLFLFSHVRVYVGNVFVSIDVNIFEEKKF